MGCIIILKDHDTRLKGDGTGCPHASKQTITHICILKGCPVAHHTLVSGLAHVPGVTAFDKFSAVLSVEDVLHSDIKVQVMSSHHDMT